MSHSYWHGGNLEEEERKRGQFTCPECNRNVSEVDSPHAEKQKHSNSQNDFEKYINILEFCPWTDAETAIKELQESGDARAIPYIRPYLNCPEPNAYRAALVALEKLEDDSLLNHIVLVISGRTDRLPILISFLNHSSFREHEKVISALVALLSQRGYLSLLVPFLSDTSLCKHKKVVPALIDLLRDKDMDLDEKTSYLRHDILELLGKTENTQALVPLYAHAHSLSIDLSICPASVGNGILSCYT